MTSEQAYKRYDALTAEWRAVDRWLTNLTFFGNAHWTAEMLSARRTLVAMLNKRLRELSAAIGDAFAVYLDLLDAEEAQAVEMANAA